MKIIQQRKYFYILSTALVAASVAVLSMWGLKQGIDFQGGTSLEISVPDGVDQAAVEQSLKDLNLDGLSLQLTGNGDIVLQYLASDEGKNDEVRAALKKFNDGIVVENTQFVGGVISGETRTKSIEAVIAAIIAIALYIAVAFRRVSKPVPSWMYGAGAIIALAHDVLITLGVFAILGKFYGVEIDVPFIAALLTILGYSVNDTIVVYDRTRENLLRFGRKEGFEEIVNRSLNETLGRSINTSLTVVLVLVAIILLGSSTLTYFSLALLIGVIIGTYSSIFVATALLVTFYRIAESSKQ